MSWFSNRRNGTLADIVGEAVEKTVRRQVVELSKQAEKFRGIIDLEAEINDLKRDLVDQEINESKQEESRLRKEREVEHKIGLLKRSQEFELERAKSETTLEVREKNLDADEKRFEEHMEFYKGHMELQSIYLKDVIEMLSSRLPTAEIIGRIEAGGRQQKASGDDD